MLRRVGTAAAHPVRRLGVVPFGQLSGAERADSEPAQRADGASLLVRRRRAGVSLVRRERAAAGEKRHAVPDHGAGRVDVFFADAGVRAEFRVGMWEGGVAAWKMGSVVKSLVCGRMPNLLPQNGSGKPVSLLLSDICVGLGGRGIM